MKKINKKKHMQNLHDKLMEKDGAYAKWHKHPQHHIFQWLILCAVVVIVGGSLINRMKDPESLSYGLNSEASNSGLPDLFTGFGSQHELSAVGKKSHSIDADTTQIENGTPKMKVKLPDEPTIVINLKKLERRGAGDATWRGSIDGKADSEVTITLKNGFLAGVITDGTDLYEIKPKSGKKHVVEKIDPSLFPVEEGSDAVNPPASDTLSQTSQTAASVSTASDGAIQIDLLSMYTPEAKTAAGGSAQIDALIQSAVDRANTAFINSQANVHYNLVATAEANYNDSGNIGTDLNWVWSNSTVANLRNQYGADMVSLIVGGASNACGRGYLMSSVSSSFASSAFQVTAVGCAVGNLTFAHEHGHNMGMHHDPANAQGTPAYSFSYGHYVNGVYRTVMSYAAPCSSGCTRVPYFSNPNVIYLGYPTGIANQRDNARTANLTAPIVSAFRASVVPPTTPPAAPSGLNATAVSNSQINLTWTDSSSNESGFKIERSTDGVSFAQVGVVGTNVTNFSNTGLLASTTYYYRAKAYNTVGDSAPSNVSSTITPDSDLIAPTVSITAPANGATVPSGNVTISASAIDNVGVARVEFYVDGALKATDTSAPYSYRWNTRKVSSGTHSIQARAYDAAGNIGTASVSVNK